MVNGTEHIFVERQGRVEELEKHFDSVGQLEDLIQQIVSRVNRTVNLASPIADADWKMVLVSTWCWHRWR